MNSPDYRMQEEAEHERMDVELAIVRRIGSGMTTLEDATYIAASFGLTNVVYKEAQHEQIKSNG